MRKKWFKDTIYIFEYKNTLLTLKKYDYFLKLIMYYWIKV